MKKNLLLVGGGMVVIIMITIATTWSPAEKTATQTSPTESQLAWDGLEPGVYEWKLGPTERRIESLGLTGKGSAVLKIVTTSGDLKVSLKDEFGQIVKPEDDLAVAQAVVKQPNGETVFIFKIKSNPAEGKKDWQLIVANPNPDTPTSYNLTLAETPPISADSTTENEADGQADLSLTLEETISLNVTVPVVDATVVATITDPNGQTTTITLTENPDAPGTYTGTFDNIDTPGLYQITYVITGEDFAGQPFDQVVTDQFTVPDPNVNDLPIDPNPIYQSIKKFDINQADDIRPIY